MTFNLRFVALLSLVGGCALAQPFSGPGFDGELASDLTGPFLAVATYAEIAPGQSSAFDDYVDGINDQLDQTPGVIGHSLRAKLLTRDRWTLTVWEDEAAMIDFVTSEVHMDAMAAAQEVLGGFNSARYEVTADELPPDWGDALDALDAAGEVMRFE